MRKPKYQIGQSGINFLIGALNIFTDEKNIFREHVKKYPNTQSSIKFSQYISKLENIIKEVRSLIKKSQKELKV